MCEGLLLKYHCRQTPPRHPKTNLERNNREEHLWKKVAVFSCLLLIVTGVSAKAPCIFYCGGGGCVFLSPRANPPIRQQIPQVVMGGTFSKWHCRAVRIVILLVASTARAGILLFDVGLEGNGENKSLAG